MRLSIFLRSSSALLAASRTLSYASCVWSALFSANAATVSTVAVSSSTALAWSVVPFARSPAAFERSSAPISTCSEVFAILVNVVLKCFKMYTNDSLILTKSPRKSVISSESLVKSPLAISLKTVDISSTYASRFFIVPLRVLAISPNSSSDSYVMSSPADISPAYIFSAASTICFAGVVSTSVIVFIKKFDIINNITTSAIPAIASPLPRHTD